MGERDSGLINKFEMVGKTLEEITVLEVAMRGLVPDGGPVILPCKQPTSSRQGSYGRILFESHRYPDAVAFIVGKSYEYQDNPSDSSEGIYFTPVQFYKRKQE